MSPWWLCAIIPASASVGAVVMALMTVASRADDEMERWDKRG
jgi:hypothetical protein